MNALERQLAALLTEAPGEPPTSLDPDAIVTRASGRRRMLAPALAAAAVVAVAVPVAVVLARDSGTKPVTSTSAGTTPSTVPMSDPKADAIDRITAALQAAPVPPGAVRSERELDPVAEGFATSGSPTEVRRTAWWTALGAVRETITYLKAHAPAGMGLLSRGASSNGGEDVEFADRPTDPAAYPLELDYYLAPYASGVAIRIDSWTTWVANRPDWSFVPADATSVDLTVVRDAYNEDPGGAPTVRRALTGDALTRLADAINALPPRAPEGAHSCPAMLVRASDGAVFHTPDGVIHMVRNGGGCAFNATITAPPNTDEVYVLGNDFTAAVLSALGLPANYGFAH